MPATHFLLKEYYDKLVDDNIFFDCFILFKQSKSNTIIGTKHSKKSIKIPRGTSIDENGIKNTVSHLESFTLMEYTKLDIDFESFLVFEKQYDFDQESMQRVDLCVCRDRVDDEYYHFSNENLAIKFCYDVNKARGLIT